MKGENGINFTYLGVKASQETQNTDAKMGNNF